MTLATFYKHLAKLKGKYKIEDGRFIRSTPDVGYCPLVGVANLNRKANEDLIDNCIYAGSRLGFTKQVSFSVMDAADGSGQHGIRLNLLKALGLGSK